MDIDALEISILPFIKKKKEGTLNLMCKISMQECSKSEFVLESLHSTWINDSLPNKKIKILLELH